VTVGWREVALLRRISRQRRRNRWLSLLQQASRNGTQFLRMLAGAERIALRFISDWLDKHVDYRIAEFHSAPAGRKSGEVTYGCRAGCTRKKGGWINSTICAITR
jgi:hypothetical protein